MGCALFTSRFRLQCSEDLGATLALANPLLVAVASAMRAHGLAVELHRSPDGAGECAPDGALSVRIGSEELVFQLQIKPSLRPGNLAAVLAEFQGRASRARPLVVSGHISTETGALLRSRGVAYADAVGNVWIRADSVLVFVEGRRAPAPSTTVRDGLTPAVLQVMFAILRDPSAIELTLRGLGARAGVSHAAARQGLAICERRGWVRRLGRAHHAVVDLDGMLASWTEGFASRLGPALELARATWVGAPDVQAWASSVDARGDWGGDLLAGELGATRAGLELHGSTASLYVASWDAMTMRRLRVAPTQEGGLLIRPAFAPDLADPERPGVADPLLLLGELSAVPDERLDTTREALQRRVRARWSHGRAP